MARCGDQNGLCFGSCPDGFKCARDQNGRHFCKRTESDDWSTVYIWVVIILIIVAFLIALVVFWCLWSQRAQSCTQTTLIEVEGEVPG